MAYVDGYVLVIPKKKIRTYKRIASAAGKVWMSHGALQFCESVAEDTRAKGFLSFPKLAKPKKSEVVVFSFVVYKSRADRDKINAKVMKDPRILKMMKTPMPFDHTRMTYGGFTTLVDL